MKEKRNFVMPLMKAMAKRFMKNAKMNAHHSQDVENLFHTIINSALTKIKSTMHNKNSHIAILLLVVLESKQAIKRADGRFTF
jgi:hypothetical protein